MSKYFRPLIVFLTLTIVILACALPVPSTGQPDSGTPIPPAGPDRGELATAVALTLTALAPTEEGPTAPVPSSTPTVSTTLLPRTLYYLATDSAGLIQVFRMEQDGKTQHQITSESDNVSDYDVSPVDGSVAYIANNQLLYIQSDGLQRRVLMAGGAVDVNNPFMSTVSSPVFALNGQTIAYGYKGLRIYSFASDKSQLMIQNQVEAQSDGLFVPKELYSPERYSPDGSKLLITLGYYEGASSAIYDPATNALQRLDGGEGALICCEDVEWSSDSSSIYAASPSMGMFSSGLWKVDAATGKVTTLIEGGAGGSIYNGADEAYLAPDGQLYFFFGTFTVPDARTSLQLVRSAPDGVTGRTVLSKQDFQLLNEALWAPDASFVIAVFAPTQEVYVGGQAEIVYLDGRQNVILTPSAEQMKWGP